MQALILNGSRGDEGLDGVQAAIAGALSDAGWISRAYTLRDRSLVFCTGCSECWTTTPGRCRADVAGEEIARAAMTADLMIWLTPVTFGGYSYELKKAIDRLIGLMVGPVGAAPTRRERPGLLGFGLLGQRDARHEVVFEGLVRRQGALLGLPRVDVGFLEPFNLRGWSPLLRAALLPTPAPVVAQPGVRARV